MARAHGLEGELGIRTFDPASEVLFDVERIQLRRKDGSVHVVALKGVRPAKDILIEMEGVNSRTQAEAWVGSTVAVFREDVDAPEEGEYFQGDLVGLDAFDEEGNALGRVESLFTSGPVPNLVIGHGADERMVPFADEFVPTVDLAGGRIVVRLLKIEE